MQPARQAERPSSLVALGLTSWEGVILNELTPSRGQTDLDARAPRISQPLSPPQPKLSPRALLRRLVAARLEGNGGAADRLSALLAALARARLATAREVLALHEQLLFARAYPLDARVAATAERLLTNFSRRSDFRRFRAELADSGIAGTEIRYPFFWPTALRLARALPRRLAIDWESFDDGGESLRPLLLAALAPSEAIWLRERRPPLPRVLRQLAGSRKSDAEALLELLAAMPGDDRSREAAHDTAAPFYKLLPGPGTPNRTLARLPRAVLVFRGGGPRRGRPDLAAELARPPLSTRIVRGAEARELVELCRDAMACRARDLDCFSSGDARDVRRFGHDDGLEFVAIGSLPERRLLLATAYGLLSARNGVPIGYVQLDGFLDTALVHFNTFDTFRGADAAWVFARALATARALFGSTAFAIEPYQLGQGNDEALDSGAFWFYWKLGFRPRDRAVATLARAEIGRFRRRPGARSSRPTLARLAASHLYWEPFGRRATVPPHAATSRAVTATLAATRRPRAKALADLVAQAGRLCRLDRLARLTSAERFWLEQWAPLLVALPEVERWSLAERRALGELVRAKAGARESDLVPLTRAHPRFGLALVALAQRWSRA